MAVGPSPPQRMPQTAMTTTSTRRCLRLRGCRGSESDSKYEPREPTSTSLATRVILGSVRVGRGLEERPAATRARGPDQGYRPEARRARSPRLLSYTRGPWHHPRLGGPPDPARGTLAVHRDG